MTHETGCRLLDVRRRAMAPLELSTWSNTVFYQQSVSWLAPRRLRIAALGSPARAVAYRNDPDHN